MSPSSMTLPFQQFVNGAAGLSRAAPTRLLAILWDLSYQPNEGDAEMEVDATTGAGEVPKLRSRKELGDLFSLAFSLAAANTGISVASTAVANSNDASRAVAGEEWVKDTASSPLQLPPPPSEPSPEVDSAPHSLRETDAQRLADAVYKSWFSDAELGIGGVSVRLERNVPFEALAEWCESTAPCLQLCLRTWAFEALLAPAGLTDFGPTARYALPSLRAGVRTPPVGTPSMSTGKQSNGGDSSCKQELESGRSQSDGVASLSESSVTFKAAASVDNSSNGNNGSAPAAMGNSPELRSAMLFDSPSGAASGLFGLSLHALECQATWRQLYASTHDGLSFNRLSHALQGYTGPCVLLLEDDAGGVFGAYCASGFKPGNTFAGGSSTNFMFR